MIKLTYETIFFFKKVKQIYKMKHQNHWAMCNPQFKFSDLSDFIGQSKLFMSTSFAFCMKFGLRRERNKFKTS